MSSSKPTDRGTKVDAIALDEAVMSIKQWYSHMLSQKKIILLAILLGGLSGILYAWLKPVKYVADCTFVLEEDNSSMMGQYAGLASMIGINLGGLGGGKGLFQGDNLIELYKSRSMLKKTLLSEVSFNGKNQLLVERYIEFNEVGTKWKNLSKADLNFRRVPYTIKQDSILRKIVKDINKNYLTVSKPDKKLSLFKVEVISKDQLFAKNFTDKIVQNVNEFYGKLKTKKSLESVAVFKRQADSVRRMLDRSISGTAIATAANPNANMALQMLKVPSQKFQVDIRANAAIYEELVKNLEMTRISLRRETPLIQVVDSADLPLDEKKIGKLLGLVIGSAIAGVLIVAFLILKKIFSDV
ncbi:MAG TPA: lipopolysaccharide biosynthesis protein [Pedobacter sp.]